LHRRGAGIPADMYPHHPPRKRPASDRRFDVLNVLHDHSVRNAIIGASPAALDAGNTEATNAANASAPAAVVNATGSQKGTPYNCADNRYPAPTASGTPSSNPSPTRVNAPPSTRPITFLRSAPSAMRTPISLRRRATVYAVTPYRPIAARIS